MNSYKIFCIFILITSLLSCETKHDQYYLKSKWQTSALSNTILKAGPKSVIEYFYRGIMDINTKELPKHGQYESFAFNEAGDITEHLFYFSGTYFIRLNTEYKKDGYSIVMYDDKTKSFETNKFTDFIKTGPGEYTEYHIGLGNHEVVKNTLVTYKNNGNEITEETTRPGDTLHMRTVVVSQYDGQRLLKKSFRTGNEEASMSSVKTYYYSKEKWLDSTVYISGQKLTRTYFKNNEHGDPVEETTYENSKRTAAIKRQFIYDLKGNWIRMLEKDDEFAASEPTKSPYVLIQREIRY